jgi:hypothetical protein
MDEELRTKLKEMRALPSAAAAKQVLERYPPGTVDSGYAYLLIPHLSWSAQDQMALGKAYLQDLPFASPHPYEAFATIMPLHRILRLFKEFAPTEASKTSLFLYHVEPILKKRFVGDVEAIEKFDEEIRQLAGLATPSSAATRRTAIPRAIRTKSGTGSAAARSAIPAITARCAPATKSRSRTGCGRRARSRV